MNTDGSKSKVLKDNRVDGIDLLRGISIIAVILTHINQKTPIEKTFVGNFIPWQITSGLFRSGYLGVVVFFVISGFLITSTSLKRWKSLQEIQVKQFYLIRFARIAPCLFALMLVLSALHTFQINGFAIDTRKTSLAAALGSALTFRLNWLEASRGGLPLAWGVLWSLSIEETFYLFFPLACRFLNKLIFPLVLIIFIILGPFARTVFSNNQMWLDHSYLSCMDGIALGCLTALFASKYSLSKKTLHAVQWSGLVFFLCSFICKKQINQIGLTDLGLNVTLLEFATALLLIAINEKVKNGTASAAQITAPIRWFGRYSYEVYLTHLFFVIFLSGAFVTGLLGQLSTPVSFALGLAFSGCFGAWMARYFSEPANRMIRARTSLHLGKPIGSMITSRNESSLR